MSVPPPPDAGAAAPARCCVLENLLLQKRPRQYERVTGAIEVNGSPASARAVSGTDTDASTRSCRGSLAAEAAALPAALSDAREMNVGGLPVAK